MVQYNSPSNSRDEASAHEERGPASEFETEKYLAEVEFPAQKADMVQRAREADAPNEVLEVLGQLPDREYNNADDVAEGITEARH